MYKKNPFLKIFLIILILSITIGCNNDSSKPQISNPTTKKVVEKENLNPYTGLPADELLPRPFAIIIENHNSARPQAGLQEASIVYEILVEGGITRFLAIFTEPGTGKIGPIRSVRPYFALLAKSYNAIIAHCGYSRQTKEVFNNYNIDYIDERPNGSYYWRDMQRQRPHNLFTNLDKLGEGAETLNLQQKTISNPPFTFTKKEILPETSRIIEVNLPYSNYNRVMYQWDYAKEAYIRYNNENPHIDSNTNEPINIKNIIIQYVNQNTISSEGHLAIDMVGEGRGLLITHHKMEEITWKLDQLGEYPHFYVNNNEQIKLTPGNTWIHFIPAKKEIEVITEQL